MACAASTDPDAAGHVDQLDLARRYCLDPQVTLRPEPFGALAYHYGNRRLTFVRSHDLVDLLGILGDFPSLEDALDHVGIVGSRRPAIVAALTRLRTSEVIHAC